MLNILVPEAAEAVSQDKQLPNRILQEYEMGQNRKIKIN
jgi:hypothetical protein